MREFDLKEAKAGAPVCTRDGRDVRIICLDANYKVNGNPQPIVALINEGDCETLDTFQENGKFFNDKNEDNDDLFMKDPEPTLSDYTTIKTYEDACKALGQSEITDANMLFLNGDTASLPKHILALMKLETISKALRNGATDETIFEPFLPIFDKDGFACEGAFVGGMLARLYQDTEAKAEYFGTQFIDLWMEYLEAEG